VTVVTPTGKILPSGTPNRVMPPESWQSAVTDAVPSVASETTVLHVVAPGPVYAVTLAGAVTAMLHGGGGGVVEVVTVMLAADDELSLVFSSGVSVETVAVLSMTEDGAPAVKFRMKVDTAPLRSCAI